MTDVPLRQIDGIHRYVINSRLEGLIMELTEALLKDRPERPRHYLLGKLEEEVGDGIIRETYNENHKMMEIPGQHLVRLFESTRCITAEIVPKDTIDMIISETIKLLGCDRVSLFVYSPKLSSLVLTASNLSKPIRVLPGQGI